jgi:hypothetical protein
MDQDEEHLRLLSIFHYVVGGITGLFSCFPIFHLVIGIALLNGAFPKPPNQPEIPVAVGWMFIGVASFLILLGWSMAIAIIVTGRSLARRRWYLACMVVAGIECLMMPLGTILGVFTLVVLLRPSVKTLFTSEAAHHANQEHENPWA